MAVTAGFALDTVPPQISNISVAASASSATVSWQTDEPSTGFVDYGLTSSYGLGPVASGVLSTIHSLTLPGLSGRQVYHYRVTAEDSLSNGVSTGDATFTASSGGPNIDV